MGNVKYLVLAWNVGGTKSVITILIFVIYHVIQGPHFNEGTFSF